MSIEATAAALAPETAAPVEVTVVEDVQPTEDDLMEAVWDKAQDETPEVVEETPEEPVEEEPEPEAPVVEAPSELPKAVRDRWGDIPDDARTAILDSQREMGRKLAENGRLVQGIKPIQDVLVDATKEMPALRNMQPEQVAREIFDLAKVSNDFAQKPVETMMGLIKKHNLGEAVGMALQGQPQSTAVNQLVQQNKQLAQQVQTLSDRLNGVEQQPVLNTVNEFAQGADHWGDVESTIPTAIAHMRAVMPEASPRDVLQAAYDLEIQRLGKAKPAPSEEAAPADPEQTQKALKAKSVNVQSKPNGEKPLTEDQLLEQVWRKNQS